MDVFDFRVLPKTPVFFKNHLPEPIEAFKPYYRRYHYNPEGDPRFAMGTLEKTTEEMQSKGVRKALICASCAEDNIQTFEAIKQFPDIYHGMATVKTAEGLKQAFRALETAYDKYGFSGLGIQPYIENIYADDRRYYPLYALSQDRGKFVHIHASFHYHPHTRLDLGDPKHIDQLALDFPDLKIVIGHAGHGFGSQGAWIAEKHPNVYIDLVALGPKYLDPILLHMANTVLRKKVIYGSGNPLFDWDFWTQWTSVIKEENQALFFHDNAMRVVGLAEEKQKAWNAR